MSEPATSLDTRFSDPGATTQSARPECLPANRTHVRVHTPGLAASQWSSVVGLCCLPGPDGAETEHG